MAHPSPRVRASIASRIRKRGGDEVRELLLKALQSEGDPKVKLAITVALGSYRTDDVVQALTEQLECKDLTQPLIGQLLLALGKTRHASAIECISPYLKASSWADVIKAGALLGLGATRDPAVMDQLIHYMSPAHTARVRAAAASSIAKIGGEVEAVRAQAGEALMEMAQGKGFRDLLAAIAGLAQIRESRALDILSLIHQSAPDGRVRRAAYEAKVAIQRGRKTAQGLETLRKRVDSLAKENAKLRSRLDHVEVVDR